MPSLQTIIVVAPTGQQVTAVVPPGCNAGSSFVIAVPPAAPAATATAVTVPATSETAVSVPASAPNDAPLTPGTTHTVASGGFSFKSGRMKSKHELAVVSAVAVPVKEDSVTSMLVPEAVVVEPVVVQPTAANKAGLTQPNP